MMRRTLPITAGVITAIAAGLLLVIQLQKPTPDTQARLLGDSSQIEGFERAAPGRAFDFPADHGAHSDYQTEWWYYTGNLETADGRHFGYQLTIFRRGLIPASQAAERDSEWGTSQVYMGHFALSDMGNHTFHAFERFSRGAAGLAGVAADPYHVWLEDWQIETVGEDTYRLRASQDGITIDLQLIDTKGPVLQGINGYSQKGPDPGSASYYYSLSRLESSGAIQIENRHYEVNGLSWMDHEFSTSALSDGQIGWDWFALQLDDGSELKVFHIRREDGTVDPFSAGMYIAADGSTEYLSREDFEISTGKTWRSPNSGATYPAQWTVSVPSLDIRLQIEPYMADQELHVSYAYWEGAVKIEGSAGGRAVTGSGYIEMTGYVTSMAGQF